MDRVIREMAGLISLPSVSSTRPELDMGNRAVIDRLAEWFAAEGFAVEVMTLEDPGRGPKANLVATRGRGPGGLVLAGHTDTVPWDEGRWRSDPFALTERDGCYHGLGAADMKGFFALVLEAARRTRDLVYERPLTVLATADEECGMAGARALVEQQRALGHAAVIGEPTSLRPVRMHKGITMEYLRLRGRSGHSSDPSLGVSALEGMRAALDAIAEVRARIQRENVRAELHPPVPTLNLGSVHGGDNPNRICAECELQYDLRVLPGMDERRVRDALRTAVERVLAGSGLALEMGPLHEAVAPFETDATAAIVRAAEELTGHAAGGVSFGTEAPYLTRLGMQTLVLGPGDIEVAHQPDEHLPGARIGPYVDLLTRLIARFCAAEVPH